MRTLLPVLATLLAACPSGTPVEPPDASGSCARDCSGRQCGDDGCGGSCGGCPSGKTCGGGGQPGLCGSGCVPETDGALCARLGRACGPVQADDNCSQPRKVDCGACSNGRACKADGTCTCSGGGASCLTWDECCSQQCNAGTCAPCGEAAAACGSGCCDGLSCLANTCYACKADGAGCSSADECCGYRCNAGKCASCEAEGSKCGAGCCSGLSCVGGTCKRCRGEGASCTVYSDCCSLNCDQGVCKSTCTAAGQACAATSECCSGERCLGYPGFTSCCVPNGQGCGTFAECCSGSCQQNVCVCSSTGACEAKADCCAGAVCSQGRCCTPDCAGKQCGDDGCGGSCGGCAAPKACQASGRCDLDWKDSGQPAEPNFYAVWGASKNDVWAVGQTVATRSAAISRWQGSSWKAAAVPTITGYLSAVWGSGASDVWAVGEEFANGGNALLLHWQGSSWTKVALPSACGYDGCRDLVAVAGTGPSDVWAGGYGLLHWNGSAWSVVDSSAFANKIKALLALSPTNVWAVTETKVWRYDGSTWTDAAVPQEYRVKGAAWAFSATDLWVASASYYGTEESEHHWNGSAWASHRRTVGGVPGGMWGASATDLWEAGTDTPSYGPAVGYLVRWNGTDWAPYTVKPGFFPKGVWASGASDVWAVGNGILHWGQ